MASVRVNDLLYFVNYKRKIISVADIIPVCKSFYTADAILEAKKLFFDCVVEKIGDKNNSVLRFSDRGGKAGESAQKMNLKDLLAAMNKCDDDGIELPPFVSSDPTKVPCTDDGKASLNQLMCMIIEMKKQISNLEKGQACSHCASAASLGSTSASSPGVAIDTSTSLSSQHVAPPPPPPPPLASLLQPSSLQLPPSSSFAAPPAASFSEVAMAAA